MTPFEKFWRKAESLPRTPSPISVDELKKYIHIRADLMREVEQAQAEGKMTSDEASKLILKIRQEGMPVPIQRYDKEGNLL